MKRLPNILTLLRGLGAAALIGLDVNRAAFWLVYALCGLSDMLDGPLARRLHAEGALGERLDSAADGLLVVACAVTLLPLCAFPLWGWIGALTIAREFAMLRMRALRHTRLNRLCGLILRLGMPLILEGGSGVSAGFDRGRAGCALHEKAMKRLDKSRDFSLE